VPERRDSQERPESLRLLAHPAGRRALKKPPGRDQVARLRTAATAVPQTKPNWTIVVSHAASDVVSPQIERSWGGHGAGRKPERHPK